VQAPAPGDHRRARRCQHTPSAHSQIPEKNKKMSIATRYVDIHSTPVPVVRTRSVTAPSDGGTSRPGTVAKPVEVAVTREEYEALLARVVALETVTRNVTRDADRNARNVTTVTHNADDDVTRNVSNAERQRRYRERLKAARVCSA
jgi:hypothetical protein